MVQSEARTVEAYLDEARESQRAALVRLRELCRGELAGFGEVMAYGMPAYTRDGTAEIAFAGQRQYISLYLMRPDVRDAFAKRLAGQDMGKGCLRFRRPDRIDYPLVRDLLRATAASPGPVC
ncbi:iron chaperone [Streptomyces sp. NPDC056716]|uniref:iron chaperone n=1 Tax=unclassified Streptomyces TaxID=2593676 RepID=UPI003696EF52